MRRRWTSTALALFVVLAAVLPPDRAAAQTCSPRPNVVLLVSDLGGGRMAVLVAAGAGAIRSVQFPGPTVNMPGPPNYAIEVEGQRRPLPFTLLPPFPTAVQVT